MSRNKAFDPGNVTVTLDVNLGISLVATRYGFVDTTYTLSARRINGRT